MARCPICGEVSKGICKNCYDDGIEIAINTLTICPHCFSLLDNNNWTKKESIEEALCKGTGSDQVKIKSPYKKGPGLNTNINIEAQISKKIKNKISQFHSDMSIPVKFTECSVCKKLLNKTYYEGIFQYRDCNKCPEIKDYIEQRALDNNIKGIKIVKTTQISTGIDYYFNSSSFMLALSKELKQKFGGIVKKSAKLFTRNRQTSKEVYRTNILYKPPHFMVGDVIIVDDRPFQVKGFSQEKVKGVYLDTGKTAVASYEENCPVLTKFDLEIIQERPELYVIHPETYQNEKPINQKLFHKTDKVEGILHKGQIYLII
ncbi:hypothetical protein K9M79_02260 [Candidatus Woesearchaeota archaeon]|nr:hypothetical protein [Candidatus Woesearchaeota archaeon]